MGRPPKYDWDDKRDICYKLYVEDKLSGTQIVKYFAKHFHIAESELPASDQFHQRFRKWGFPRRREPRDQEEEARLVARTRDLFNQNMLSAEIQKTLNDEGWDMDDYHFRVMRKKHGMLLRNSNGFQPGTESLKKRRRDSGDGDGEDAEGSAEEEAAADEVATEQAQSTPALPPEEAARRAQRLAELQVQSDQLLQTKKRRRRIRGYGHLPPDAPGMQPRYGSETSLDECKAFLRLSNENYVQIRAQYHAICRDMGIVKMTLCAEGQWQASKDRLVRDNMHLSSVLHPLQIDQDKRTNALNVICTDVTKRMRNENKKMTIADANNALGLDPHQSKEIRRIFYEILEADQFTTVVACGKVHLEQLEEQWYAKSDVLRNARAEGDALKLRAIYLLSKDARKRYCDDQVRKDPSRRLWQKQKHYGPGPGPAQGVLQTRKGPTTNGGSAPQTKTPGINRLKTLVPVGPAWEGEPVPEFRTTTIADMVPPINFDLDPLLNDTTHGLWPQKAPRPTAVPQSAAPASAAIPAYFRLAVHSAAVGSHPRMWLGKLSAPNVGALRQAALSKAGAARMIKAWGVVKNPDGSEDRWLVEGDDELGVYLQEAGEKATFVVVLEGGYA